MGKVLGIVNRKGGVGKTTTATTLSYLLSKEGCKVGLTLTGRGTQQNFAE